MKITIVRADGVVGVDGVFRTVDLSALDSEIHAIQFDTERATGNVEFDALATEEVDVRDLDAEQAQEKPLREALEKAERDRTDAIKTKDKPRTRMMRERSEQKRQALNGLQPVMKKQRVPRRQVVIDSFEQYQGFVDAWRDV